MRLSAGDTLLFIGDSITDAGRDKEWRDGESDPCLGDGYVRNIATLLAARYPEVPLRVINQGVSGDTVRELAERWDDCVLAKQPDWLSIMIGINDVWRQFDMPLATEQHVNAREFEQTLGSLVERTASRLKGLVLMTPFFVDSNMLEPMRQLTERYATVVRKIARRFDAVLVDTQAAIDDLMQHYQGYRLSGDRVHPTATGHMVVARSWLQAMDFSW